MLEFENLRRRLWWSSFSHSSAVHCISKYEALEKVRERHSSKVARVPAWREDWRNRPLPSSKNPHFQNEARCTTFLVKMSFICMRIKNDFCIKGWAPTLVLKQRPGGTRKWPICSQSSTFGFCDRTASTPSLAASYLDNDSCWHLNYN